MKTYTTREDIGEPSMTYVVTESCIKCKLMDCVDVCPVDCFFEGENMLVIDPDICIDCGVCVPECPIEAIEPDTLENSESWVAFNRQHAKIWPNIKQKGVPPEDSDQWKLVSDKMKYFDPKPGSNSHTPSRK